MAKRAQLTYATLLVLIVAGVVLVYAWRGRIMQWIFAPTASNIPQGVNAPLPPAGAPAAEQPDQNKGQNEVSEVGDNRKEDIAVVTQGLKIPWEMVFLPDGDLLVTERPGTLKRIGRDGAVIPVDGVAHRGEGGLLGMALHPRFIDNHLVYLYLTTNDFGKLRNRVERYRLEGDTLDQRHVIIDGVPGAQNHDGGRIAFGPDGLFYITTGDAQDSTLAQDRNSLAGKILRINDDGSIPADNPFGNAVYSYGHRNPQGLAWDSAGRLWATEHGRSGVLSGLDELNLIVRGGNYGWPVIQGDETKEGMVTSVVNSGPRDTWAPSGAAFINGSIFFGGLRGQALYQARLNGEKVNDLKIHFREQYGRIRAVVLGPDGFLYFTTSNTDGRGRPKQGDDKIIRVNPDIFR